MRALLLFLSLIIAPFPASGQEPPQASAVRSALSAGSERALLEHAGDRIEIGMFGATQRYSRAQAAFVLRSFFRDYPPDRIESGSFASTPEGWFAAVDYWYERGTSPLKIYLRLRKEDGDWILREMVVRPLG